MMSCFSQRFWSVHQHDKSGSKPVKFFQSRHCPLSTSSPFLQRDRTCPPSDVFRYRVSCMSRPTYQTYRQLSSSCSERLDSCSSAISAVKRPPTSLRVWVPQVPSINWNIALGALGSASSSLCPSSSGGWLCASHFITFSLIWGVQCDWRSLQPRDFARLICFGSDENLAFLPVLCCSSVSHNQPSTASLRL